MRQTIKSFFFATSIVFFALGMVSQPVSAQSSSADLLHFTILHTNDEHAALVPKPQSDYALDRAETTGGIARVATLIRRIRAQKAAVSEPVVVVSAGDFISGSPFSWLTLRSESPELALMIESGYDIVTLGNHEFDYGPDRLTSYLKGIGYPDMAAQVPIVATNTVIPEGHELGTVGIQGTHIKRLSNGLVVGFFGLMGVHAADVAPMAKPIEFSDQVTAAKEAVRTLQDAGVDVIVLLSHSGENEELDLANEVPGIDLIVGGHTHSVIPKPLIAQTGTIIVQTGTEFQFMGKLEFEFNVQNQSLRMINMPDSDSDETYLISIDQTIPEDPRIKALVDQYGEKLNLLVSEMTNGLVNRYDQIIARSDVVLKRTPSLSETPLGNFVADAMLSAAEKATSSRVDFVFQASGVIRGDMVPSRHPESLGNLSFYDVVSLIGLGSGPDMLPGYPMVSIYFTGEEIRRVLEITVLLSELMDNTYFLQNSRLLVDYDPSRSTYLTIPFTNTPLPSGKSVLQAKMYTGEGRQSNSPDDYVQLRKGDQTLYHVVSDYYNASFLPMVGEVLPNLKLVMKDEIGNPVNLEDRIIYYNGGESKVWEAVVMYLMDQPADENGIPTIDATYAEVEGRWNKVEGGSILIMPITIFILVIIVLTVMIILIRRRKKITSTV